MRGVNSANIHWVTKDALHSNWTLESTYKIISLNSTVSDTSMLYECTGDNYATNFITNNSNCEGYRFIQALGYIYNSLKPNTAELYRCFTGKDHFVSSNITCMSSIYEGSLGFYILS